MWGWILLAVAFLVLLLSFVAAGMFFRFSIARDNGEKKDPEFQNEKSIWHPFRDRMLAAQKWLELHTTEHVTIESYDGLKLAALYVPAEMKQPKGTLIVFHGYRSLATVDFALEAEFNHDLGYRVLLPYQRAHGESEGKYITYGVKERFDCQNWARYVQQRFGPGEDIFLGGISMGCATVVMASGLDLPQNVRGIIADCGFISPWAIMKHVAKRDYNMPPFPVLYALNVLTRLFAGFGLREADTLKALRKNTRPILFLHGETDDFVPVWMTKENYAACKAEKEIHLVKGAGHAQSFAKDTPGCEEKIASFLERNRKA